MRSWYAWVGQVVLLGGVTAFVWRSVARSIGDLGAVTLPDDVRWWLVAGAGLMILVTYGVLIGAWMSVLRGWAQHLPFSSAARIWCLSNLGRYVPGKIWSFAGMAILAEREGITGWAALAAALVMQVLALGTGAAVAVGTMGASGVGGTLHPTWIALAILLTAATIGGLSFAPLVDALNRLSYDRFNLKPASLTGLLLGASAALASWLSYGLALWLLAQALVPGTVLPFWVATGVFATGYIVGLMAVVVPGGIGVREGILLSLLTPWLGISSAGLVTVASRLVLTVAEVTAALGTLFLTQSKGKPAVG
jgi:glycosyltransferase 2 family protein